MVAPMMDDININTPEDSVVTTTTQVVSRKIQTSILREQFYLKHILFCIEKYCVDFFDYLKIDKKAFLRRKRKKLLYFGLV